MIKMLHVLIHLDLFPASVIWVILEVEVMATAVSFLIKYITCV